jgi:hypothetical protein
MGIFERSLSPKHLDVVPPQLIFNDSRFPLNDGVDAPQQLLRRRAALEVMTDMSVEKRILRDEGQDSFSERLAGNRAVRDAEPADDFLAFNYSGALAQLRGLNRGVLTGWSTSYAEKIEFVRLRHRALN